MLGRLGDRALGRAKLAGVAFGLALGSAPASVKEERFAAPDVFGEPAIALRLARLLLSIVSATSAMLRAGRPAAPAKMTSSISPPRRRLAEVSPITQRSASTRFDLPQPFGPTMPVRPGSIASSAPSTKDLNPTRRSRSICISGPVALYPSPSR